MFGKIKKSSEEKSVMACQRRIERSTIVTLGASSEPCQMMADIAVVLLNGNSMLFSDDMPFGRQNLSESVPVICEKEAIPTMLHLVVKPPECRNIALAENPSNRLTCASVYCFDEPEFVFFEPMKCHISSNSISSTVSLTYSSSMLSAYARIHLYTCVWSIFKISPIILYEFFPFVYIKIHNAFFASIFLFVRLSPFLKLYPHSLHLYL